jgi:hypothetical protein
MRYITHPPTSVVIAQQSKRYVATYMRSRSPRFPINAIAPQSSMATRILNMR